MATQASAVKAGGPAQFLNGGSDATRTVDRDLRHDPKTTNLRINLRHEKFTRAANLLGLGLDECA